MAIADPDIVSSGSIDLHRVTHDMSVRATKTPLWACLMCARSDFTTRGKWVLQVDGIVRLRSP